MLTADETHSNYLAYHLDGVNDEEDVVDDALVVSDEVDLFGQRQADAVHHDDAQDHVVKVRVDDNQLDDGRPERIGHAETA